MSVDYFCPNCGRGPMVPWDNVDVFRCRECWVTFEIVCFEVPTSVERAFLDQIQLCDENHFYLMSDFYPVSVKGVSL